VADHGEPTELHGLISRQIHLPESDPGHKRFATLFSDTPLHLEYGGELRGTIVAYETWGELKADKSNAILVLHALTGDSHAVGNAGPGHPTPGWWDGQIGPGMAIDTNRYYVVCPNVLGGCQGTTGPSSIDSSSMLPFGSRFPKITIRDQARLEIELSRYLGIERWQAVIGGSMGGMRALEHAVLEPDSTERLIVLATTASASAEQIALCSIQIEAIELDSNFHGGDYYSVGDGQGPTAGMMIARKLAMLSYRSDLEFGDRFGRTLVKGKEPLDPRAFEVESYLHYHGEKLNRRFDPNTYIALSRAMNSHDLGRDRGGVDRALGQIKARTFVAGIESDRLYPLYQQKEIASSIRATESFVGIESSYGHDGFLIEESAVATFINKALA
ncbi:unnamed protein product, partial [Acidithrix sp. C25]